MKKYGATSFIDFNSPVILSMALVSLTVLIVNIVTAGLLNRFLGVYYTSWLDPLQYLRLMTHVFAHQDIGHYTGNFLMILAIGPLVEEKYGSRNLAIMFAVTAVVTGLINIVFFRGVILIGASGIVFMLILLASFTNIREGRLPLTVLLVAVLYLGNEIVTGLFSRDNISQISHILGGLCGAGFGLFFHADKLRARR